MTDHICPIYDCRCPAGDAARIAFARVNLMIDEKHPDDQYWQAWDQFEAATMTRFEQCRCPTQT